MTHLEGSSEICKDGILSQSLIRRYIPVMLAVPSSFFRVISGLTSTAYISYLQINGKKYMQAISGYEFERRRLSPVPHSAIETSIRVSDIGTGDQTGYLPSTSPEIHR